MWFAVLNVNAKKHLETVIKDRDGWKARCLEVTENQDTWKNRCQEVATSILSVLDLIYLALIEEAPRTLQLGLVERCRKAWEWFQEFVKEAGEYTGAHVLSMVHATTP